MVRSIPTQGVVKDSLRSVCFVPTEAPGCHIVQTRTHTKYDRRLGRSYNESHVLFPSAMFFFLEYFQIIFTPWYEASRTFRRPPVCHSGATRSRVSDNPLLPATDVRVSWSSCLKRLSARRIPTPLMLTWTTRRMNPCRNSGVAWSP